MLSSLREISWDSDIHSISAELLGDANAFDDTRKKFIKNLESIDVQACPGSGKTTTLLAKLGIIAKHHDKLREKGICVLTHTNVAIDEIRTDLGNYAGILLNYPNFFGTIQSFVDKYLAIPQYVELFGYHPIRIDKDTYFEIGSRFYSGRYWKFKPWLERQYDALGLLLDTSFDSELQLLPPAYRSLPGKETPTYKSIEEFKLNLLRMGYLSFEDAYALAELRINAHPRISEYISDRFAGIFIDEMQDTNQRQINLIERIFNRDKCTLQRIGDHNQAIYGADTKASGYLWTPTDGGLEFPGSLRFGTQIADRIKSVCVTPQDLSGNPEIVSTNCRIIIFDTDTIDRVVPMFGHIIIQESLHMLPSATFKIVGRIGKPNDKHRTLPSYWMGYNKSSSTVKREHNYLSDYCLSRNDLINDSKSASFYKDSILLGILKVLRIAGAVDCNSRHYGVSSFWTHLNQSQTEILKTHLASWAQALHTANDIHDDMSRFIKNDLLSVFGIGNTSPEIDSFLQKRPRSAGLSDEASNDNVYVYNEGEHIVNLVFNTVHGVKGETHAATLFVETFFNKRYDLRDIKEYIKGRHTTVTSDQLRETLRIAYVAMSRPRHLLCLAMHVDSLTEEDVAELIEAGWDIVDLRVAA